MNNNDICCPSQTYDVENREYKNRARFPMCQNCAADGLGVMNRVKNNIETNDAVKTEPHLKQ